MNASQILPTSESVFQIGRVEIRPKPRTTNQPDALFGDDMDVLIDGKPVDWSYISGVTVKVECGEFVTVSLSVYPKPD